MHISKYLNGFDMKFIIQNNNINLTTLFYFDIMNMLYTVNSADIIDNVQMTVNNPVEMRNGPGTANIQFLFHHLFKDCGVPRYYLNLDTRFDTTGTTLCYISTIRNDLPPCASTQTMNTSVLSKSKPMPIAKMDIHIEFLDVSTGSFLISFLFDPEHPPRPHQEKMVITVFKKMFSRLKEFIEKME